jgi:hypothetical protein
MVTSGNTTFAVEREPNCITIGPRLHAELARRIHELESRFKPTHAELRELAALMEILKAPEGRQ